MKIENLEIPEIKLITPTIFKDSRGSFQESYNQKKFNDCGFSFNFVQDNYSITAKKGTIRGLHFQASPMTQTKLVRVIQGEIFDVVVDIRKNSPTFKKYITVVLNDKNQTQLLIPQGFAHGFCTFTDDCHVLYKVDNYYSPKHNSGIVWNDQTLNINWPTQTPLLSDQDQKWPTLFEGELF